MLEPAINGCSPSSDKENKEKDAAAAGDQADSPKKWTPLKVGSEGVDWSVTLDYAPSKSAFVQYVNIP